MPATDSKPVEDIVELPANYTGEDTPEAPADPPAEPAKPEVPDMEALKAQMRQEIMQELQQQAAQQQPQVPVSEKPKDEFEELGDLLLTDQAAYTKKLYEKAFTDARASVMQEVAPLIGRARSADVVDKVARDFAPETKAYVQQFAASIDPNALTGPALDLVQRAARDFDREVKEKAERPRIEAAHGESARVSVDKQAFEEYNDMRKSLGLDKVTAAEFVKAKEYVSAPR